MYLFRADGNAGLGSGHLMRCMTIAAELQNITGSPEEICFVCADDAGEALVKSRGFLVWKLGTDFREMEKEIPIWRQMIADGKIDKASFVFVDSYYVTDTYLEQLRSLLKVYYMDDFCAHAYPVDGCVGYNLPADRERFAALYADRDTTLLVGTQFSPVKKAFRETSFCVKEQVRKILITTGGGDIDNIAGRLLTVIEPLGLEIYCIVGKFSPHLEEMKRREQDNSRLHILWDVQKMAELMERCDVAISPGGTTLYELMTVGIPFICFSYVDNQIPATEYLSKEGIACYAGAYHRDPEGTIQQVRQLLQAFLQSAELRRRYSESERQVTDGFGAVRIAEHICEVCGEFV